MIGKTGYLLACFLVIFIMNLAQADDEVLTAELHIKDHRFVPDIIELPAGKKIRLVIYNDDETIEEFESIDLKREKIIPGKSSTVIILAPLKAGEYKIFGEFHEDTAQGKIIVKE